MQAGNGTHLFPGQAERFRWSQWRFKSGANLRDFVRDEVFPYMASLVKDEPQVAAYFRDAVLEIIDPNVLKQVIDELDGIDFRKLGPDVKGDVFEYLLTHLGQSALNGQFRTPRQIRAFMVQMTDPDLGDTLYDPACGTAGFLIDAVDYILARYSEAADEVPIYGEEWLEKRGQSLEEAKAEIPNLQTYRKGTGERLPDWKRLEASIYGTDVSRQMMRIAMMNLVLHGIRGARVKRANVLSEMSGLTEDDVHRRYQVILSNPPFAGQIPKESVRSDLSTKSKKSEILFLSLMMRSLAPGGRCAVVVPEGALFGSTKAHKELRERLLREFEIQAVVSLPAGVFKPMRESKPPFSSSEGPKPHRSMALSLPGMSGFTKFAMTVTILTRFKAGDVLRPRTRTTSLTSSPLGLTTRPPASKNRRVPRLAMFLTLVARSPDAGGLSLQRSPTVVSTLPLPATSHGSPKKFPTRILLS